MKRYLIALLAIAAFFALQKSTNGLFVDTETAARAEVITATASPTPTPQKVSVAEESSPAPTEVPKKAVENKAKKEREKATRGGERSVISRGGDKALLKEVDGRLVPAEYTSEQAVRAIDDYFDHYDCPIAGNGRIFVREAIEDGIDWRIVPAISMRESTGGKKMFRANNPFGWGCISFASLEEAISTVTRNLAGLNPGTAGFYKHKSNWQKLRKYNSCVEAYPDEVRKIMRDIEDMIA